MEGERKNNYKTRPSLKIDSFLRLRKSSGLLNILIGQKEKKVYCYT